MEPTLGNYLRQLRLAAAFSMNQLAQKAQISQSTISRWEADKNRPSIQELESVLSALGASELQTKYALTKLNAPRAVMRLKETQGDLLLWGNRAPAYGDLLRAMRLRKGWTLDECARLIGVQKSAVSRWENSDALPSSDHLHALCHALGAHPREMIALTSGHVHLHTWEPPLRSCDGFDARLGALQEDVWHGERDLMDLRFLSLQAQLRHATDRLPMAENLLSKTFTTYSQWLSFEGRIAESERYAYRALNRVQKEIRQEPFWIWNVQSIVRSLQHKQGRKGAVQAVRLLQEWLPIAHSWANYEIWLMRGLSEVLSHLGQGEEAAQVSQQAYERAHYLDNQGEFNHARNDHAQVLIQAGKAAQAMEILPTDIGQVPLQQIQNALIWAWAYIGVEKWKEAEQWLSQAYQVVDQQGVWRFRSSIDEVALKMRSVRRRAS